MIYRILGMFLVILLCVATIPCYAAENGFVGPDNAGKGSLSVLAAYLSEAARNNQELAAALSTWHAAQQKVPQAGALPDPRLSAGVFARSIETRTGPQRARIGLSQTLPWFGKRDLKARMAARKADAMKAAADSIRLAVFQQVKDAYYEYAHAVQTERIIGENLELLRFLENVAGARYAAGKATYADILRIQVEAERLEDRRKTFADMRKPLAASLNAAMNRRVDDTLPSPPEVPVMIMDITDAKLFDGVRKNNPRLKAYDFALEEASAGIKLARKDYYPDTTFGVDYIITDPADNPAVDGSGEDPVMVSVSMNLPIWSGKRSAAVEENRDKLYSIRHGREDLEKKLLAETRRTLFQYQDAERKIVLYKDNLIPQAHQALSVTLEAFQSGGVTLSDLIGAEKALISLDLDYLTALARQAQQLARLETLYGGEIECKIHGSLLKESGVEDLKKCLQGSGTNKN